MTVPAPRFRRAARRRRPPGRAPDVARIPPHELISVAIQGLRTRRLRAALSALGIAIGIGAMVAVVGVSASSQASLLATIDKLGTNLLTVAPGTTFLGANEALPSTALPTIDHMAAVQRDSGVYQVAGVTVGRNPYIPAEQTGGIGVDATGRTSFERDRDRDADTLAAGFGTVRMTWARLTSKAPEEAERLAAILRNRVT